MVHLTEQYTKGGRTTKLYRGPGRPAPRKLIYRIQTLAYGEGELVGVIGLLQIIEAAAQDEVLADNIRAITARENYFEPRTFRPELLGQFAAIDTVRHDEIGQ